MEATFQSGSRVVFRIAPYLASKWGAAWGEVGRGRYRQAAAARTRPGRLAKWWLLDE